MTRRTNVDRLRPRLGLYPNPPGGLLTVWLAALPQPLDWRPLDRCGTSGP